MRRPIAFDLSRLYWGGTRTTPRGIDRVEMSLAGRLFGDPARRDVGLVPTLSRMGVMTRPEVRTLVSRIESHWREAEPPDLGRVEALRRWIEGAGDAGSERLERPAPLRRWGALTGHCGAMLAPAFWTGLRPAAWAVPKDAVYVNTGQLLPGWRWPFRWLDRRPDVKVIMMLHDAIPLDYPEYAGPMLVRRHAGAIATAARYATAMLATSEASAAEIRDALRRAGRGDMPFHVVPLPVSGSLLPGRPLSDPAARPYFVVVGVVDQRKNHRLLLHIWRDMLRAGVAAVPKLVVVGSQGMRTAGLIDLIARSPGLRDVVSVASGLSSPALREVIGGARALLAPSFAEGFGLPLAEAMALGVPVIASDIAAHREVGGLEVTYLDPLDGLAWRDAVLRYAGEDAVVPRRPSPRQPQNWDSYVAGVLSLVEAI